MQGPQKAFRVLPGQRTVSPFCTVLTSISGVFQLAGGKPEKLLFAQDVESVAVASHGNRLAFAQVHHSGKVFQLALASQTKLTAPATKLISSTRGDAGAHVSPDGKHIAFQSWRSGNPEVWVCDRDASNPVQLTSFGGPSIGEPRWSPDSRQIVFDLRPSSGKAELYFDEPRGGTSETIFHRNDGGCFAVLVGRRALDLFRYVTGLMLSGRRR